MSTIYIKNTECEKCKECKKCDIKHFKDVTIVIDHKKSIHYISFEYVNKGEHSINSVEIILPFLHKHISNLRANTKEEVKNSQAYNECSKLLFKLEEPLISGRSCPIKIGFKVLHPKSQKEMRLHVFNLSPIEKETSIDSQRLPLTCTKTMKLYITLPKRLRKNDASVAAECYKKEDIKGLIKEIQDFFVDDKMFSTKKIHGIFEWTNKQLSDLEDELEPAFSNRLIRFEFTKKDSVQIFGFDCSYGTIFAITLSIISIIIAILI